MLHKSFSALFFFSLHKLSSEESVSAFRIEGRIHSLSYLPQVCGPNSVWLQSVTVVSQEASAGKNTSIIFSLKCLTRKTCASVKSTAIKSLRRLAWTPSGTDRGGTSNGQLQPAHTSRCGRTATHGPCEAVQMRYCKCGVDAGM